MGRKKKYSEEKNTLNLTLTETAVKWLKVKQAQFAASSLSDAIERMAREQHEAPDAPSDEQKQLILNKEDSEALVEALLNPPLPNEALLAAAALYRQMISA